jgi:ATP-dependent Clp protease adaptor protein ClpS
MSESQHAAATPETDQVEELLPPKEAPRHQRRPVEHTKTRRQPPYNVIIWNDEEHTYDYVIELLMKVFGHPFEKAFQITDTVHHTGRGIAFTTHQELAELKREQVMAGGADWRMEVSRGPIRATIEPAS